MPRNAQIAGKLQESGYPKEGAWSELFQYLSDASKVKTVGQATAVLVNLEFRLKGIEVSEKGAKSSEALDARSALAGLNVRFKESFKGMDENADAKAKIAKFFGDEAKNTLKAYNAQREEAPAASAYGFMGDVPLAKNITDNFLRKIWSVGINSEGREVYSGALGQVYNEMAGTDAPQSELENFMDESQKLYSELAKNLLGSVEPITAFHPAGRLDETMTENAANLLAMFKTLKGINNVKAIGDLEGEVVGLFEQLTRVNRMLEGLELAIKSSAYGTSIEPAAIEQYFAGSKNAGQLAAIRAFVKSKKGDDAARKAFVEGLFKSLESEAAGDPLKKMAITLVLESHFGEGCKLLDRPLEDMTGQNYSGEGSIGKAKRFYQELSGKNGLLGDDYSARWSEFSSMYGENSTEISEKADLLVISSLLYSLKKGADGKHLASMWENFVHPTGVDTEAAYGDIFNFGMMVDVVTTESRLNEEFTRRGAPALDGNQLNAIELEFLNKTDANGTPVAVQSYTLRADPSDPASAAIASLQRNGDLINVKLLTGSKGEFSVNVEYNLIGVGGTLDEMQKQFLVQKEGGANFSQGEIDKFKAMLESGGLSENVTDTDGNRYLLKRVDGTIYVSQETVSAATNLIMAIGTDLDRTEKIPSVVPATLLQSAATLNAYYDYRYAQNEGFTNQVAGMKMHLASIYNSRFGSTFSTGNLNRSEAAFKYMKEIESPPSFMALDMAYQKLFVQMRSPSDLNLGGMGMPDIYKIGATMETGASFPERLMERFRTDFEPKRSRTPTPQTLYQMYNECKLELAKSPVGIGFANYAPKGYWKMGRYPAQSATAFRNEKYRQIIRNYDGFEPNSFQLGLQANGKLTETRKDQETVSFATHGQRGGSAQVSGMRTHTEQGGIVTTSTRLEGNASNLVVMGNYVNRALVSLATTETTSSRRSTKTDNLGNVTYDRQVITTPLSQYGALRLQGLSDIADYNLSVTFNRQAMEKLNIDHVKGMTDTELANNLGLNVNLYTTGNGWWNKVNLNQIENKDERISNGRIIKSKETVGQELLAAGINLPASQLTGLYSYLQSSSTAQYTVTATDGKSYYVNKKAATGELLPAGTVRVSPRTTGGVAEFTYGFMTYKSTAETVLRDQLARYYVEHRHQLTQWLTVQAGVELDRERRATKPGEDNDRMGMLFGFQVGSKDQLSALVQKTPSDNFAGIASYAFDTEETGYAPKMVYAGGIVYNKEEVSWDNRRVKPAQGEAFFAGYDVLDKFYSMATGSKEYAGLSAMGKGVFSERDELGSNFIAYFPDGKLEVFSGRGYYSSDSFMSSAWLGLQKKAKGEKEAIGGGTAAVRTGIDTWLIFNGEWNPARKDPALIDINSLGKMAEGLSKQRQYYQENPDKIDKNAADRMIRDMSRIMETNKDARVTDFMKDQLSDLSIGMVSGGRDPYAWKVSLTRVNDGGRYLLTSTNLSQAGPFRNASLTFGIQTTNRTGPGIREFGGMRFAFEDTAFMLAMTNDENSKKGLSNTIIHDFGGADAWMARLKTTAKKDGSNFVLDVGNQKWTFRTDYGRLQEFKTAGLQTEYLLNALAMVTTGAGVSRQWSQRMEAYKINAFFTKANVTGSSVTFDGYYTFGDVQGAKPYDWGVKLTLSARAGDLEILLPTSWFSNR